VTNDEGGKETLRVMVVDDHALFRRGLEMVLGSEPDIELVGEASDGEEAIQKATEVMPDIVLMDVRMPKRSGIEATAEIKELMPHVKILMLTISDEETDLYDAIKAGASGYLLKEIPIEEVADAIRGVWAGQSRISPSMASKLLTEFAAISKGADERPSMPAPRLTDREMEVLRLVAQGKPVVVYVEPRRRFVEVRRRLDLPALLDGLDRPTASRLWAAAAAEGLGERFADLEGLRF
jgi:two-component system NarL family response regulator